MESHSLRGQSDSIRHHIRHRFTAAKAATLWLALCFLAAACAPTVKPGGIERFLPRIDLKGYHTDDGQTLPVRFWGPDEPTAVVLGLHGFGDYSNAFDETGERLGKAGIRTYSYDQRGFGRSQGRGHWHGIERMVEDTADAVQILSKRYPGKPVYLLGLSMGGAVAMVTAAERQTASLSGIALVAPAVWGRDFMPAYQRQALWLSAHSVPWYPLTGMGFRIQPSDNIAMLRRLGRDPHMLRHIRVDMVWGLTNLMDRAVSSASKLAVPSLFLYGLKDDLIPVEPTRYVLNQVPPDVSQVGLYENGHHMLLRDIRGTIATKDLADWFAEPGRPLPSGADQNWLQRLPE